jgi:hypothetical protein
VLSKWVIQAVSSVERVGDGDVDAFDVELDKEGEVGALTCIAKPSDKCKAGSGRITKAAFQP